MATCNWVNLYPNYQVQYLNHSFSDHSPILLDTRGEQRNPSCYKENIFRFEAKWCLDSSFKGVLSRHWNEFSSNIPGKLEYLGLQLQRWSKVKARENTLHQREIDEKLSYLYNQDPSDDILVEIVDIQLSLNLEADQKQLYWEQRARVNGLKDGDRNTNFFYKVAVQRKLRGKIKELEGEHGEKISTNEDMLKLVTDFFWSAVLGFRFECR